jgi:hypothetical protein
MGFSSKKGLVVYQGMGTGPRVPSQRHQAKGKKRPSALALADVEPARPIALAASFFIPVAGGQENAWQKKDVSRNQ